MARWIAAWKALLFRRLADLRLERAVEEKLRPMQEVEAAHGLHND